MADKFEKNSNFCFIIKGVFKTWYSTVFRVTDNKFDSVFLKIQNGKPNMEDTF